jgi:dimethylamine/trimethylamine dehydrogenase
LAPRHVLLATGSHWRADAMGHHFPAGNPALDPAITLTPDDLMAGQRPADKSQAVIVFDDDHYLMAAVLAELLAREGYAVTYVTTAGVVGFWSRLTMEQARSQARLIELGVQIIVSHAVEAVRAGQATLSCVFSGKHLDLPCGAFVSVTSREPDDTLWHELQADPAANKAAGILRIQRIGDCKAPGLIAHAVYDGHRTARRIDGDQATSEELPEEPPFRRDRVVIPAVL